MKSLHLRRPSPALVVACLALLAALAGTGVAAVGSPGGARTSAALPAIVVDKVVGAPGTSTADAVAVCPPGRRATGGGAWLEGSPYSADTHIVDSEPALPGTPAQNGYNPTKNGQVPGGWHATVYNANSSPRRLHVYVLCA